MSELFDNNSFEQWLADGAKDAAARGLDAARKVLDSYVAPGRSTRASRRR
jgi:trimethylamine:corrinoid methyltransferase-like protein